MNAEIEIWKDVPEYEGHYQVSSLGNVKSIKFKKAKILKSCIHKTGYPQVALSKNGKVKTKWIHQLVAESFLGHVPCRMELVVNHKNFIRHDNRLDNLEIITARENSDQKHLPSSSKYVGVGWCKIKKKWRASLRVKGKRINLAYFKEEKIASIYYNKAKQNEHLFCGCNIGFRKIIKELVEKEINL
jgi:hypothetical protein